LLFPEAEEQRTLFPRGDACGNAIRKAYLCNAPTRKVQPGDMLLFLRTGLESGAAATAAGVTEATMVSTDPDDIIAFVGNRTVYTARDVRSLCRKGEVLAIRFRFDRALSPSWTRTTLRNAKVLEGSAQSIFQVNTEGVQWIRQQLDTQS
jgi:hypothetical protein